MMCVEMEVAGRLEATVPAKNSHLIVKPLDGPATPWHICRHAKASFLKGVCH
jgi:hypothetical protein